jgi:hypothetical protein
MTYIVWYNTKYDRQFEVVVPRKVWLKYKATYGAAGAASILVAGLHRPKSRKNVTTRRKASATSFVIGSMTRPDIYGPHIIKVGATKKAVLERKGEELLITRSRRSVHKYRMHPRNRQKLR